MMKKLFPVLLAVGIFFFTAMGVASVTKTPSSVTAQAVGSNPEEGTWGDNLTWSLTDGTLTISGNGTMRSFENKYNNGWLSAKTRIKQVIIEPGVTTISDYAFYDCLGLKRIQIPNTVVSIGKRAFKDCYALTDIEFSGGVTTIKKLAFENCTGLKVLKLPEGLVRIEQDAFKGCVNIEYLYVPSTLEEMDTPVFEFIKQRVVYIASQAVVDAIKEDCKYLDIIDDVKYILFHPSIVGVEPEGILGYKQVERVLIDGVEYISCCSNPHVWEADAVDAPCESVIPLGRTCIDCELKTDYVVPHVYDQQNTSEEYVVEIATCGGVGTCYYSCVCGKQGNKTFTYDDPEKHPYGKWHSNEDGTHTRVCAEDESHQETKPCHGTATCSTRAICEDCGAVFGDPLGHSFTTYVSNQNATCLKNSTKTAVCDRDGCETTDTIEEKDTQLEHTPSKPVKENAVVPDCTQEGRYDEVVYCAYCKTELSRERHVLAKLEHDYSTEWTIDETPTCEKDGSKSRHCTVCGDKTDVTVIESTGHTLSADWTYDEAEHWKACVDCEEQRFQLAPHTDENTDFVCDVCGFVLSNASSDSASASDSASDSVLNSVDNGVDSSYEIPSNGNASVSPKKDTLTGGEITAIVIASVVVAGVAGFSIVWFAVQKKSFGDLLELFRSMKDD